MWWLAWLPSLLGWTCLLCLSDGKKESDLLDRPSPQRGTVWLDGPAILPMCDPIGTGSVDMKRVVAFPTQAPAFSKREREGEHLVHDPRLVQGPLPDAVRKCAGIAANDGRYAP